MATKNWLSTASSATFETLTNWSGGTAPVAGDDINFTQNLPATATITLSAGNISPQSIYFADTTSPFYWWILAGTSQIQTFGAGTTIRVRNATAALANVVAGTAPLKIDATSTAGLALYSLSNLYTGGTQIESGSLTIAADLSLGPVPVSYDPANVLMKGGTSLVLPDIVTNTMPANRGIRVDGASTIRIPYSNSTTINLNSRITGSGSVDLYFNNIGYASTIFANNQSGTFSNSGGVRISSTYTTYLYTTGSATLGSSHIQFYQIPTYSSRAAYHYNYFNPAVLDDTFSNNFTFTPSGTSSSTYYLIRGVTVTPTAHTTRRLTGNISTGGYRASGSPSFYLGASSVTTSYIERYRLSGNNSSLYSTNLYLGSSYASSFTFVGANSLPHPSSTVRGSYSSTYHPTSDTASWIFSGSMTFGCNIDTSKSTIGTKLNVENGCTVNHTGGHLLTGSLTRNATAIPSWQATSFTGQGTWVESGKVSGAGSLVLEPGSKLVLNNPSNTFTGVVSASNATLTVGPLGGDESFGAVPAVATQRLFLQNSTLVSSATLGFSSTRSMFVTGSTTFDIESGKTLKIPSLITGSSDMTLIGGGTLVLSGANNLTGSFNISSGILEFMTLNSIPQGTLTLSPGGSLILPSGSFSSGSPGISLVLNGGTLAIK